MAWWQAGLFSRRGAEELLMGRGPAHGIGRVVLVVCVGNEFFSRGSRVDWGGSVGKFI